MRAPFAPEESTRRRARVSTTRGRGETERRTTGGLDAASANRVLSLFRVHVSGGLYEVLPLRVDHFDLAREWIGRFSTPLRTLDALHLALAFERGAPVVTADRRLASSAEQLGMDHELLGG